LHSLPVSTGAGNIPTGKKGKKGKAPGGNEDRYRLFVENFQGIAFQGEIGSKPGFFHGGIEKMTGFKEKDFTAGRLNWDRLVHPEDRDRIRKEMEILREHPGRSLELEYRIMTKGGQPKWVHETLQAGPGGILEGAIYDITAHKRAEEQLQASLREKDALLKEIHHRVKNNLQIIQSLLSLQSGRVKDAAALEMLRESRDRVHSMALIHERICMSRDLNRMDFYDYVRKLVSGLFQSYGRKEGELEVVLEIEDIHIGIDEAVPCGMILGELLSNSLKHAFPSNTGRNGQRGELRVQISSRDDGTIYMAVADNGIGLPAGLDFRKTDSLGLELVTTLTQQLGGTIELERSRGTEFHITFKSNALEKGG
jgi:PAS domain S-box-containing protein